MAIRLLAGARRFSAAFFTSIMAGSLAALPTRSHRSIEGRSSIVSKKEAAAPAKVEHRAVKHAIATQNRLPIGRVYDPAPRINWLKLALNSQR